MESTYDTIINDLKRQIGVIDAEQSMLSQIKERLTSTINDLSKITEPSDEDIDQTHGNGSTNGHGNGNGNGYSYKTVDPRTVGNFKDITIREIPRKRAARKTKGFYRQKPAGLQTVTKHPASGVPIAQRVTQFLRSSERPQTLDDIVQNLLQEGIKSRAKNLQDLRIIVRQQLHREARKESGIITELGKGLYAGA